MPQYKTDKSLPYFSGGLSIKQALNERLRLALADDSPMLHRHWLAPIAPEWRG